MAFVSEITCIAIMYVGFTAAVVIPPKCLSCICKVEGCERQVGRCQWDVYSQSCGPYQIKQPYWIDCGRPDDSYADCTKQMQCSRQCVQAYMERYAERCTSGRQPTCQDFARIHNGGPRGCRWSATLSYWRRVENCCRPNCDSSATSYFQTLMSLRDWKGFFRLLVFLVSILVLSF